MDLALIIYLISLLDVLTIVRELLVFSLAIALAMCAYGVLVCGGPPDPEKHTTEKYIFDAGLNWVKKGVPVFIFLLCIPNQDTAYKMLAAYGVEAVATSEAAQRLAPKSLELLEATIDNQLKALRQETKDND